MKYLVLAQHELELQCILLLGQRKKSQVNKRQRQSSRQPRGIVQCSQKDEVRGMRGLEVRTVRWSSRKSSKNSLDSGCCLLGGELHGELAAASAAFGASGAVGASC